MFGSGARIVAGVSCVVMAQAAMSAEASAQGTAVASASSRAADSDNADDEIIVTAQRREESLADVPISITALAGDALAARGLATSADLTLAVPGLLWVRSSNFSQPTIRGIGSRSATAGVESNVATFIDGVYQPDQSATQLELSDVERIEVLKGPQGTLFGRNATGGAINIVTRRPSFDWTGSLSASYGKFDYYKISGYLSGPIVEDKLAISLSGAKFGDDGYVRNIFLNETEGEYDGEVIRGKLLFQPTETLKFGLNGFYAKSQNAITLSAYSINGNNAARGVLASPVLNPTNIPASIAIADKPFTTSGAYKPFAEFTQKSIDAHVEWDLDFATLTGLASWGNSLIRADSAADMTPFKLSVARYPIEHTFRNQDLVLTSNGDGRINWLVGATGFQANGEVDSLASITPTSTTFIKYGQRTTAWAGFGEVTWQAVDHLFLTGGLRYNWERKTAFNQINNGAISSGRKSFDRVSKRAVARYEFGNNSSVYASYTEGFKSGAFNPVNPAGASEAINPEIVKALEAGVKVELMPGVHLNAAAFHYDYTDLQVSSLILVGGAFVNVSQNAGKAKIKGFEAELNARITSSLKVFATVALLDTKISDFPNATVSVPRLDANGVPLNNGNITAGQDVSGKHLIRAPASTFSIGANYNHDLFGGRIEADASIFFSSKWYSDLNNRVSQPAYEVANASLTWHAPGDRFSLGVFGRNLTNEVYTLGPSISALGDVQQVNKPRWFGVTAGVEF